MMMTKMARRVVRLISCVAVAFIGGCLVTSSEDIDTSNIYAAFTAEASTAISIDVAAELHEKEANGTGISLADSDVLKATVGDKTQALDGALSTYSAVFSDLNATAGTQVKVTLERASKTSAPNTVMTMPDPFEIVLPPDSVASRSRASDLIVTWSPSGTTQHMKVGLAGDCIEDFSRELDSDPGTFTIAPSDIKAKSGQSDVTCEATLKVSRSNAGTIDPAFASGSQATAVQSRNRWFDLTP